QINQAAELLEKHQFNQALSITQKAVKTTPDLPDVLIGYAQLLAAQGKHRQAAEQIVKALEFTPAHWDARLRLVDEWLAAGMREQAITELAQLKTVFPDQPAIQEREAAVAGTDRVPALKKRPAPIKSTPKKAVQPVRESLKPAPAETLQILLEADDLPAALEANQDKLDADLLALVRENANAARADGEVELAEGLDNLAAYIEGKLGRG
ncbi:MAG: tetratricopeptide repeat protein, partial [Anaerolineales bacterium]|nr:tetratricopeptide repeat protein [Anaerolineales bacterium]